MIYLAAISAAVATGLLFLLLAELVTARPRVVRDRLAEVETIGVDVEELQHRRRRREQRDQLMRFFQQVGLRMRSEPDQTSNIRRMLTHAGYSNAGAATIFWGIRLILALGLGAGSFVVAGLVGGSFAGAVLIAVYFMIMGWVGPIFWLRSRVRKRQKEIQLALPDTLDLLVICVEAGLGLNQALVRVSEEIRHVSETTSLELTLVNLEIRAGIARDQALRNLAERTGVEDLRSLIVMLIQADRFGTSIARSLRVHSDTMREKRRQRAEEAAAKTTIKMVFPLVLFIFPALFVVTIGPAFIQIIRALSGFE